ncbi:hypothetical protein G7Z17_g5182 [Cylindrodendrum hubeiense]|uniref:Uncharacterized protein n=1 Tax=Cylindrodendrum hubeiense TaxID=595255 RepID=A0A9P5H7A2_9HYPO|nr:hypothetical protein G7Z17_g5182 [Cylindrodendrum hubeiense]
MPPAKHSYTVPRARRPLRHLTIRGLRAQRQPAKKAASGEQPAGRLQTTPYLSPSLQRCTTAPLHRGNTGVEAPRPLFPAGHVRMGRWVGVWRGLPASGALEGR